jgi:IS5 family transposase
LATQTGFEKYGRRTRRELFLEEMEQVVPWSELEGLVRPHYPKGENGRPPVGLSVMLRIYFVQQWFNLSDPGAEDALYESTVLRRFAGVDLGRAPAPDETTLCKFRHLLEAHELGDARGGEPSSGLEGHPHCHWHDRRCDPYPRAFVDQELGRRA